MSYHTSFFELLITLPISLLSIALSLTRPITTGFYPQDVKKMYHNILLKQRFTGIFTYCQRFPSFYSLTRYSTRLTVISFLKDSLYSYPAQ